MMKNIDKITNIFSSGDDGQVTIIVGDILGKVFLKTGHDMKKAAV